MKDFFQFLGHCQKGMLLHWRVCVGSAQLHFQGTDLVQETNPISFFCSNEKYKNELQLYFYVDIKHTGPKYVCVSCLAYFRSALKKGQPSMRFIKFMWQEECSDKRDTCNIFHMQRKGGKPCIQTSISKQVQLYRSTS